MPLIIVLMTRYTSGLKGDAQADARSCCGTGKDGQASQESWLVGCKPGALRTLACLFLKGLRLFNQECCPRPCVQLVHQPRGDQVNPNMSLPFCENLIVSLCFFHQRMIIRSQSNLTTGSWHTLGSEQAHEALRKFHFVAFWHPLFHFACCGDLMQHVHFCMLIRCRPLQAARILLQTQEIELLLLWKIFSSQINQTVDELSWCKTRDLVWKPINKVCTITSRVEQHCLQHNTDNNQFLIWTAV